MLGEEEGTNHVRRPNSATGSAIPIDAKMARICNSSQCRDGKGKETWVLGEGERGARCFWGLSMIRGSRFAGPNKSEREESL
ncbi:hypothetical protein AAC387_Pa09g1114 [Persea americana]